jgi:hypothetical protein
MRLVPAILVIYTSSVRHKSISLHEFHQIFNHSRCSVRHAAYKKTSEYPEWLATVSMMLDTDKENEHIQSALKMRIIANTQISTIFYMQKSLEFRWLT